MKDDRIRQKRGRGAVTNPGDRYAEHLREAVDDGWHSDEPQPLRTELSVDFTGSGPVAALLRQRFELAARRLGLQRQNAGWDPDSSRFRPPGPAGAQLLLFDTGLGG